MFKIGADECVGLTYSVHYCGKVQPPLLWQVTTPIICHSNS